MPILKISQLLMEYDPAPPFDMGSPEKAGPELVQSAMQYMMQVMGGEALIGIKAS